MAARRAVPHFVVEYDQYARGIAEVRTVGMVGLGDAAVEHLPFPLARGPLAGNALYSPLAVALRIFRKECLCAHSKQKRQQIS